MYATDSPGVPNIVYNLYKDIINTSHDFEAEGTAPSLGLDA